MVRDEIFDIYIEDMSDEGNGIGRIDDMVVFVTGAVPGDRVRCRITGVKKRYAFADTIEVITPSEDRQESGCPCSKNCGGCVYREMTYEASCRIKEKQVRDKLKRIGKIEDPKVNSIITMEDPFRYRNKGEFPVKGSHAGCYAGRSHRIIDVEDCLLHPAYITDILRTVRKHPEQGISQITVRTTVSGDVMIIADTKKELSEDFIYELDDVIADDGYSLESIYSRDGKLKHAAGARTLTDRIMGMDFEVSPDSFLQTNPVQTEKLYRTAIGYMGLTGNETVLDLYCGIGTIGLLASRDARKVIGIESVHDAVIDANRNAVINGIVDARYVEGEAEYILPELLKGGYTDKGIYTEGEIIAVVDPPRAGCDREMLISLAEAGPKRIVYVSCDAGTLARDIHILTEEGYEFIEATPVDMFPWTEHVETVAVLEKTKN